MPSRDDRTEPSDETTAREDDEREESDQRKLFSTTGYSRRNYLRAAVGTAAILGAGVGTASAATSKYGISFDRVVHAVDDLGLDPNGNQPIGSTVQNAARDGTLIQFPDGDFLVSNGITIRGKRNFGIVGSGNTSFVAPGSTKVPIIYKNVDNGLFADLTLDQTRNQADFATKFLTPTYNHVENVDVVGYNQQMDGVKLGFKIVAEATESSGKVVLKNFKAADGSLLGDYIGAGGGMYLGPGHVGTARIIDCHLEEWANNGIYAGRANGPVQVVGGIYRNNDVSQVRLSGPNSYVKGAQIEVDMSKSDNPGTPRNQRGVEIETGRIQKTGGGVYDCDIRLNNSPNPSNAIFVHGNAGYADIENTRIEVNRNGSRALRAAKPQATNGGSRPPAPKPHYVKMHNVSVTGSANGREAIKIVDRPNSEVTNSCIHQTGSNRDGVKLVDSDSSTVQDDTIDVTDQETVFVRSQVDSGSITTSGTCPAPGTSTSSSGSTSSGSTTDTSGSTSGTSGSTTDTKSLVVEPAGSSGAKINYSFTVDGTVSATSTVDANDTISGSSVDGIIRGQTDEYEITGSLTDFQSDGDLTVTIDGQAVDLSQFQDPTWKTLHLSADSTQKITYSFTVDGDLRATDTVDPHESIDGSSVDGILYSGVDDFEFTGSITDFQTDGDVTATVDGEPLDLSQFDSQLPNTLAIDGTNTDSKSTYTFSVSGDVEKDPTAGSINSGDVIDGSSVSGSVYNGVDGYRFSGDIVSFDLDGTASVQFADNDG